MKKTIKWMTLLLALAMALTGFAFAEEATTEAAPEAVVEEAAEVAAEAAEEEAAKEAEEAAVEAAAEETEEPEGDDWFDEWNADAPALKALIEYVEAVTDPDSPDFIPEMDRIATFDMDGTLMGELYPTYLEYYLLARRILTDESYQPDAEMLEFGRMLRDHALDKSFPEGMDMLHAIHAAKAYAGMTLDEFADFVTRQLVREVDGFEGMTYGESFYLPMVEVVEYLQDNGFTCYVCSGSDRFICRVFIEGMLEIPYNNIIGMDVRLEATEQGEETGLEHTFSAGEDLVRTDELLIKNLKTNKVLQIAQEIGQKPVLSFGNSGGDTSMHNYVIGNNPYRSAAFMLIANDAERDYGIPEKAEKLGEEWEADGFQVISMRDDFRTIYGDGVEKTGSFRWAEELAEDRVPAEDSPEWVGNLDAAQDAEQLFVVAGVGQTTASVSMHQKDSTGQWKQILSTPGFIGRNGLGKEAEGDGKTPVGVFRFNAAFGIAEDPGCALEYKQVDEDDYWSGDMREGYGYNTMVCLRDLPDLDTENSERIMDYSMQYQYCLNISYNEDGTPGRGSAIFLHCFGPEKPFCGGCVAIPADKMLRVMQNVLPGCTVVIDSLQNISPELWEKWGLG